MKRIYSLALLAILAGCASSAPRAMSSAHSECLVCKKNADLACVDIDVDKTTPSAAYNGKTYYFCSDECKKEFEKNPAKFAGR